MTDGKSVAIVIPALDEEEAIGRVLAHMPYPAGYVTVVDNGSVDRTVEIAHAAGARVIAEPRLGYGAACYTGFAANPDAEIIVFLDADFSEEPEQMTDLVGPIEAGEADFVLGRRVGVGRPWHARVGTRLCVAAINAIWGSSYQDLGPFRAIRRVSLEELGMQDRTWGWTIEMQVKAAEAGLPTLEIPVRTRPRIGQSKISGTVGGTVKTARRMIEMIAYLALTRRRRCRVREGRALNFADQRHRRAGGAGRGRPAGPQGHEP
jgi:glycosyltransferase involved in cell wall biosynthesis